MPIYDENNSLDIGLLSCEIEGIGEFVTLCGRHFAQILCYSSLWSTVQKDLTKNLECL